MSDTESHPEGTQLPDKLKAESERTPNQIEREIEQTRRRMSRDIEELGRRLKPQSLKQEATDAIGERARELAEKVAAQGRYTGYRVVSFIRENPSLVAAMGLGAVWLVQRRNRSPALGDRMARYVYTRPQRHRRWLPRRIDRVKDQAQDALHRTPSLLAAGAAIVGLAIGLLVEERAGERGGYRRGSTAHVVRKGKGAPRAEL